MNIVTELIPATGGPLDDRGRRLVLIAGGCGFIVRAAGKLLQRSGYRVISVDWVAAATAVASLLSTKPMRRPCQGPLGFAFAGQPRRLSLHGLLEVLAKFGEAADD